MSSLTPPGTWGHIDLGFGGESVYDATWFGPLTAAGPQVRSEYFDAVHDGHSGI